MTPARAYAVPHHPVGMVHQVKKQVKGLPIERQGFVAPAQLPSGAINLMFLKLD